MSVYLPIAATDGKRLSDGLLVWYDVEGRDLPWRVKGGQRADPYRVWLSEVMLQQTTVAAVMDYFAVFVRLWPRIEDLANAPLDDILVRWAGLGYYARARNLHRCAQVVAFEKGGHFPQAEKDLLELPGVGPYTAAAISAIAFGGHAVVVDGNVERVMARLFAETDPLPGVKSRLRDRAASLTPSVRPGDYAQAVMDLGATVCTPRKPACGLCPWQADCLGRKGGIAESLPARTPKADKPTRRGVAFWLERSDGSVLLRRRPEKGLLGGMMGVPSTPWRAEVWSQQDALAEAPATATWRVIPGVVRHTFTHFHLELDVWAGTVATGSDVEGTWAHPSALDDHALPTLMRKVIRLALEHRQP